MCILSSFCLLIYNGDAQEHDVTDLVRGLLRDPLTFLLGLHSNLVPDLFMPRFHHHLSLDFLRLRAEHPQSFLSLEGPYFPGAASLSHKPFCYRSCP